MSLNFSKKTWADGANGGTPITAAELNRHEDAIAALAGYLPVYDVQNATDTVSHAPCLLHVKGTGQMIYFDGTHRVPANQFDAKLNGDSTNAPQTKAVNSAIQSVRDSLSQNVTAEFSMPYADSINVELTKVGHIVTAFCNFPASGEFKDTNFQVSQKIPDGFRPLARSSMLIVGNDGAVAWLVAGKDGNITLSGVLRKNYTYCLCGSWAV